MKEEISTFLWVCIEISLDEPDIAGRAIMVDKVCPIHFGLESGTPLIGLGILLLFSAGISYFSQGAGALPIVVIFGAVGIFMLWAGITK